MFGRRFAYQAANSDEGGEREQEWWYDRRGHHGHHSHHGWGRGRPFFGWQMRRNPFGRGGPFGPDGPFGPEGPFGEDSPDPRVQRLRRFFGRGDLKFALLELLTERPMHGYEMMKELQERSGGMYSASPGSVYPTLQMLEDRGFVTVSEADGKKVYTITDAGRAFLAEDQPEERGRRRGRRRLSEAELAEIAAIRHEVREIQTLLGQTIRSAVIDPSMITALRQQLARMRADLSELAGEPGAPER